jgi:hypothetical protein
MFFPAVRFVSFLKIGVTKATWRDSISFKQSPLVENEAANLQMGYIFQHSSLIIHTPH